MTINIFSFRFSYLKEQSDSFSISFYLKSVNFNIIIPLVAIIIILTSQPFLLLLFNINCIIVPVEIAKWIQLPSDIPSTTNNDSLPTHSQHHSTPQSKQIILCNAAATVGMY